MLICSESRILRKLRKRLEVTCAFVGSKKESSGLCVVKETATQSELRAEQEAFCKAYCELSKGAHSFVGLNVGRLFRTFLLFFDVVFTVAPFLPGPPSIDEAITTYEPLVTMRVLLALNSSRVLGAWPHQSAELPSGVKRPTILRKVFFAALISATGVYALSIYVFATGVASIGNIPRLCLAVFRGILFSGLAAALVFDRAWGGPRIASVAREIVTTRGNVARGSAHERVYEAARRRCFQSPPLWYAPSRLEWFNIVSGALMFSTNAMTWGTYLTGNLERELNCKALAIDLVIEPLVRFLTPSLRVLPMLGLIITCLDKLC